MKAFTCLQVLLIVSLTLSEFALAVAPEYSKQESETNAWRFYLLPTDSSVYSSIVFGAQEPKPDSPFILAIHEVASDSMESAVRYGISVDRQAPMEEAQAEPMVDEPATHWWAMLLTAIGLVFYQIRRPVRPRIGTR